MILQWFELSLQNKCIAFLDFSWINTVNVLLQKNVCKSGKNATYYITDKTMSDCDKMCRTVADSSRFTVKRPDLLLRLHKFYLRLLILFVMPNTDCFVYSTYL